MKPNKNFGKLSANYLFAEIDRRVREFQASHPDAELLRLGIGDVTRPLAPAIIAAMRSALDEMGREESFRGYPPYYGYDFLRKAIADDYCARGVFLEPEEVFVSDGAKSDCGNIGELFDADNTAAICDPVYPVYLDANILSGRDVIPKLNGKKKGLIYLPCTEENGFVPVPPKEKADLVYLCFPNNPTGAAASYDQLAAWVDYANETGAVLLCDSAYEAYITEEGVPHSIFEIKGAKTCAIEFRSFSKSAGFTGVRCAYTVIPRALERGGVSIWELWARRQATKFNGVSYITQRGAAAVYTGDGRAQTREQVAYYLNNAKLLRGFLDKAGFAVFGGVNAPYLWVKTPYGMDSWGFFDYILEQAQVVTTPGSGFGPHGEGFLRLTSLGSLETTQKAAKRLSSLIL